MISIVIPAYNEEKRIPKTLEAYGAFFSNLKKTQEIKDFEIIIVINNTTDNTIGVVKRFKSKFKEINYLNFKEGGKGFAVKEGFKAAIDHQSDLIGFVDADLATPPNAFYGLVRHIRDADGIVASRYLKGSQITPKFSFRRVVVAKIFNLIVRALFFLNFSDTQCGAKLFKREALKKIIPWLTISQWAFDIDLLYQCKRMGFKIKEIPTQWKEMEESKLDLKKDSIRMLFAVTQLRTLNSRFEHFIKILKPLVKLVYKLIK